MSHSKHPKILHTQELTIDSTGQPSIQQKQSIELTRELIQSGFLKNLPGSMLPVYLYIVTHVGHNFTLETSCEIMADQLPCTPLEAEMALSMLERQKYITLQKSEQGYLIILATPRGAQNETPLEVVTELTPTTTPVQDETNVKRNHEILDYILQQKAFSEDDLVRAISSMMPAQNLTYSFRQEVDYWFKTFDKEVIKELIRRTDDAWQRDPVLNCQAYMRKIANEWLAEQILTMADLEASDKVFRQIKTLLEEFGIERQKEMTRTHWDTVYRWINSKSGDDFALSVDVAKFAIKEAIRRKSDGRPSLTYIEDNFIKPFKEAKIKNIEEAKRLLNQRPSGANNSKTDTANEKKNKWQIGIDFTRFREN